MWINFTFIDYRNNTMYLAQSFVFVILRKTGEKKKKIHGAGVHLSSRQTSEQFLWLLSVYNSYCSGRWRSNC